MPNHHESHARRTAGARLLTAATVALLVSAGTALAAAAKVAPKKAAPVRTGLENLEKQVKEFTLANGLRFLVVERHEAPVFSFQIVVNAGSANDEG